VLVNGPNPGVHSSKSNALNWRNHFNLTTPVLYNSMDVKQITDRMIETYGTDAGFEHGAYPTSIFIRPDGTIFDVRVGAKNPGDTTARFESDL